RFWERQPLDTLASSTAPPFRSSPSSASRLRSVSSFSSPADSGLRSMTPSGSCAASSAASRMRLASDGLGIGQFYVNRRERFGLCDLDEQLARQLEQREKGHHQHGDAAPGLEELGELEHPLLPQQAQDSAHV